jgi:hypothetical protein
MQVGFVRRIGLAREFGPRRRNSFSFSKYFSNYSGVKINLGKIIRHILKL